MAGYETLVKLELLHDYYKSGRSADLLYIPVGETKQLLRNQRMLFKELGGGFGVLYENFGAGTPKITIDTDLELVFGLSLKNAAHFLGVTAMDEKAPSTVKFANSCRMYFYTDGAATQLKYKVLHGIYGQKFSFRYEAATAVTAIKVTIKNETGTAVVAEYDATTGAAVVGPYSIPAGSTAGQFSKFFDLSKAGQGYYTLEVKNAATDVHLATFQLFVHDELCRQDVSGVLKIRYAAPTPPVSEKKLEINLSRAESKWKYYVVNKSGVDLADKDIVLLDKSGDTGPVYSEYTFTGNPASGGGGQPSPATGDSVSGVDTLVFESLASIPFYEDPKTGLELKIIDDGDPIATAGTVLNSNLPNPQPAMRVEGKSKVYVYV